MSINFKSNRIRDEYTQLMGKNPKLFDIVTTLANHVKDKYEEDLTITCIYRSPEENEELYKNTPIDKRPKNKPHTLWGALDIRSADFSLPEIKELENFINKRWPKLNGSKTAIYHVVDGGAPHFHIQWPAGLI